MEVKTGWWFGVCFAFICAAVSQSLMISLTSAGLQGKALKSRAGRDHKQEETT